MKKLVFSLIALSILAYLNLKTSKGSNMYLNYMITDSNMIKSFDPLDADDNDNMPVMRMLYATPLEISEQNVIISNVLEKFEYDESSNQITFKFKQGLLFEDGSPITIKDVLTSILRMAYFRPHFPVLKDIVGIQDWSAEKKGLLTTPRGIVVEDEVITIKLTKSHVNPLFRFCLELFSIIPERCIDPMTGEMTCTIPPASGYFKIDQKSKSEIVFFKRELPRSAQKVDYNKITFKYLSLDEACTSLNNRQTVVVSSEINFAISECKKTIDPKQLHWTPSSYFGFITYNPTFEPFNTQEKRNYFSSKVRNTLKESNPDFAVESSMFTTILPGYLSPDELGKEKNDYSKYFEGKTFKIYQFSNSKMKPLFDAITKTARFLKMDVQITPDPPVQNFIDDFLSGEYNLIFANSGFWAQDPIGDISMLFSKNLHKLLSFNWSDDNLYKRLENLENELQPKKIEQMMKDINKYINEKSLISPIIHFKKLYLTSTDIKSLNIPQAITVPAPWQLYPEE